MNSDLQQEIERVSLLESEAFKSNDRIKELEANLEEGCMDIENLRIIISNSAGIRKELEKELKEMSLTLSGQESAFGSTVSVKF